MKKRGLATILLAVCVLAATACGGESKQETTAKQETTVTNAVSAETVTEAAADVEGEIQYGGVMRIAQPTFDLSATLGAPYATIGNESNHAQFAVAEPLFWINGEGGIEWLLATGYEVSEDELTYTFDIREGVTFHDGSELDEEVVAWNLQMAIEGGGLSGWKSAEVAGPMKVAVTLDKPNPFFIKANSSKKNIIIVSKAAYDQYGDEYCRTHPVGTGPFVFDSMEVGVVAKFVRNENYWRKDAEGNQLPYLDGIEVSCISDPTVAAAALVNGEIDIYHGDLDNLKENLETYGMENFKMGVGKFPTRVNGIRFMANGREAKLFTDKRLRQAVAYAIDGEAVASAFDKDSIYYTEQVSVEGSPDYEENPIVYGYDPEKAKALLAEAGYPNGFDIELNIDTTPFAAKAAKLYQHYLGQVGINVEILSYATAERNEIQDREDTWAQLLISQTSIEAGDSVAIWNTCSPKRSKYRNMMPFDTEPEMEALYNQVLEASSEEEGYARLKEYNNHCNEICAQYMFLHIYTDVHYYRNDLYPAADRVGGRVMDMAFAHFVK